MLPIELSDLKTVLNGEFVHGTGGGEATGAQTDSRAVKKGDLFFAIRAALSAHPYTQCGYARGGDIPPG